ncbi:hypothetical protein ACPCK9_14810 [Streptomyces koyangensis]|uniref:hypothetical protein n=1 Tax=Streptomyces koyangensis TaxID=188770 RepID=UPI00216B4FD8|nr:hypothetical protein [Streptomyces koyangensis]
MTTHRPPLPPAPSSPAPAPVRPRSVRGGRTAPRLLAACAVTGTLLATAACSGDQGAPAARETAAPARQAENSPSPSPSAKLTEKSAREALITEADIEEQWSKAKDPQSWRDSLLLGQVDVAEFLTGKSDAKECQRLVDALYDDTLLGEPSGPSALTGFQQGEQRLLYQVGAYDSTDLDKSMKWLGTLPESCDTFTLTGEGGGRRSVEVVESSLPKVGEARQGLSVRVKGDSDGQPVTLSLDVAAVRMGTDAFTVMNGGVDGADPSTTKNAVQQGAHRLQEVQAGRTPAPTPSTIE